MKASDNLAEQSRAEQSRAEQSRAEQSRAEQSRYKWVDVSKAIAIIFVYLGHWVTQYTEAFAYAFHLQLFFLVAGFFAVRTSKRKVCEWIPRQVRALLVPYFLWVLISFGFNNIDNVHFTNNEFLSIITNPSSMQPNYWFFSAFIAVGLVYYLLYKITCSPILIFTFSAIMHMLLGEISIVPLKYNVFNNAASWPYILRVINNWFAISAVPQYLFWYSLGAIIFGVIKRFTETKVDKQHLFYFIGSTSGIISVILFFNRITEFESINKIIYRNNGILESYRICCSLVILCFVFFISKLLEECSCLNNIGKSSMSFMGLEYITHSYFALTFLPMINLGIPNINSTMCVVTVTIIQMVINQWISNRINRFLPVLNGDW